MKQTISAMMVGCSAGLLFLHGLNTHDTFVMIATVIIMLGIIWHEHLNKMTNEK